MPELWPESTEWDESNLGHATAHGISADERHHRRWPTRRRRGRVAIGHPPRSPDHGVGRGTVMAKTKKIKRPAEMTETELADYFYAHRNDLAGDEATSQAPERMDVMISTRFSQAEAAELRAAAARAELSVSAFLRQRIMATLSDKVVDVERARADLKDVYSKAADALHALADKPPSRSRVKRPRREPASAA